MDMNELSQSLAQSQLQLNSQDQGISFSSILNSLFYLGTLLLIGYYLWMWWRNTQKLKRELLLIHKHTNRQKEGFMSADESDSLALEKPVATQPKIHCADSPSPPPTGIWDAAEEGHILFEEPTRKWTDTTLGQTRYSPGVNLALEELKRKYTELIIETTKEMLTPLQQLGLENYIQVIEDLDKLVSANSQIAQLKGMSQTQTELLPRLSSMINISISINYHHGTSGNQQSTGLGGMTREELGRQIIRNRQMRELLETKQPDMNQPATNDLLRYLNDKKTAEELIKIADTQTTAYKALIPLLDEVIAKRAKYEKETHEIRELIDILPIPDNTNGQTQPISEANITIGRDGGRGQIPEGVLGSAARGPAGERWPQRYYLNKRSAKIYQTTRTLDELRAQLKNPPGGITQEEYQAKYNWIDRIGKDTLPVPDDPEIKFALPAGMDRIIPDILTDFDHNNANCQRIYEECSTRANTPGFALPNWDTADYYNYLDRLPNAKQTTEGQTPVI